MKQIAVAGLGKLKILTTRAANDQSNSYEVYGFVKFIIMCSHSYTFFIMILVDFFIACIFSWPYLSYMDIGLTIKTYLINQN